jgi:hypothetical protein
MTVQVVEQVTMEELQRKLAAELGAAAGRRTARLGEEDQSRDERLAVAEREHRRAVSAAAGDHLLTTAAVEKKHAEQVAAAHERFDAAVRRALGLPDARLVTYAGGQLDLYARPGDVQPTARAVPQGGGMWSVEGGPAGRVFTPDPMAARRRAWEALDEATAASRPRLAGRGA